MRKFFLMVSIVICGVSCTPNQDNNTLDYIALHLLDTDAQSEFYQYWAQNQDSTFDENGYLVDSSMIPLDTFVMSGFKDYYNVVNREIALDVKYFKSVQIMENPFEPDEPAIVIILDEEGAEKFFLLTSSNVGKTFALVQNNEVITILSVEKSYNNRFALSSLSPSHAQDVEKVVKKAIKDKDKRQKHSVFYDIANDVGNISTIELINDKVSILSFISGYSELTYYQISDNKLTITRSNGETLDYVIEVDNIHGGNSLQGSNPTQERIFIKRK